MIIFLYGSDTFRAFKKMGELKKRYENEVDASGLGITEINGEKASLVSLKEAIAPQSLFARKRMVTVKNIFQNKDAQIISKLTELLIKTKSNSNDNIIIFFEAGTPDKKTIEKKRLFDVLSKEKYAQESKPLSNQEIVSWILEEARRRRASMSEECAQTLINAVGNDLWAIDNEINKLIAWKKSGLKNNSDFALIDKGDINFFSGDALNSNIFALTDAIGVRNKSLAVKLLDDQTSSGSSDLQVLSMIIKHFKTIIQIKSALDSDYSTRKVATALKLHPFVAQKGIIQVRNFSIESLKNIYCQLIDAEFKAKTGIKNISISLDIIISNL